MYKSHILCVFQPFLLHSFILILLMSELLRIWILSVRSSLFTLILIERHRSQNKGSLKSKEWSSDFKERCVQLWCIDFISLFQQNRGHSWRAEADTSLQHWPDLDWNYGTYIVIYLKEIVSPDWIDLKGVFRWRFFSIF